MAWRVVRFVKKGEEADYEVDYGSPKRGYTPNDPHSLAQADATIAGEGNAVSWSLNC